MNRLAILATFLALSALAAAGGPVAASECGTPPAGVPGGTLAAPEAPRPCHLDRQPLQLHPEAPKPKPSKRQGIGEFQTDHTTIKPGGASITEFGYVPGIRH